MKDWLIWFFGMHANTGWGDILGALVLIVGGVSMGVMAIRIGINLFYWVAKALASQLAASENIESTIERLVRIIIVLALLSVYIAISALVYRL